MNLEYKKWESSFFGVDLYDLQINNDPPHDVYSLLASHPGAIFQACVPPDDYLMLSKLMRYGFRWVSTTISLEKEIVKTESNHLILKEATCDDVKEIKRFLPGLYISSRFNVAEFFQKDAADRLYDEWITKAYDRTFDDGLLVFKEFENVGGFVSYRHVDSLIKIGLLGVNPKFARLGIGSKLIEGIEKYCIAKDCHTLAVDTQQANQNALKLYTGRGFNIVKSKAWLYCKQMIDSEKYS